MNFEAPFCMQTKIRNNKQKNQPKKIEKKDYRIQIQ